MTPPLPPLVRYFYHLLTLPIVLFATEPGGARGNGDGNTALHWAALRNDADSLEALLAAGGDPDALNEAGATPLHYAITSERMVAALLARGAKPDVVSKQGITPLLGAAETPNSFPVVRRLVEAGANLNAQRPRPTGLLGNANILALAIVAGDPRTVQLLLDHHAELNPTTGTTPLMSAAMVGNLPLAAELLKRGADINAARNLSGTPLNTAFVTGNVEMARFLIEQGADPTIPTLRGHATPSIVLSAYHEGGDPAATKLLVERGVDLNAANDAGETALSFALKNGADTDLVRYLKSMGAKPPLPARDKRPPPREVPTEREARETLMRTSAQQALNLLQQSSTAFLENGFVRDQAKCVSCHQQALPAVAFGLARERGLEIDEQEVGRLLAAITATRSNEVENARQMDEPTPGGGLTLGYDADGLSALRYTSDWMMESFSRYLLQGQRPDGSWRDKARRPPMIDGPIVFTAWTLRALQLYPPTGREREVADALQRARSWLKQEPTHSHNDRVFQLLGLAWAGEPASNLTPLAEALLSEQRANGGWSQLPTLDCDAWATGASLVALHKAGIAPSHPGYQRGIDYLLRTQFSDGSWWVRSRSWPFQPHFDGKFPHGKDQWISAGGTAWATIAILLALEPTIPPTNFPTAQEMITAFHRQSADKETLSSTAGLDTRAGLAAIDFARDIQPVFERSCAGCHGDVRPKGALSLRTREDLLRGGQSGEPAIVPGQADASPLFLQVAGHIEDLEMPPLNRRDKYPGLSATEIERLRLWIEEGAPWPSRPTDAPAFVITSD